MKACAIIAEYNPFHKGHKYHIEKARDLTPAHIIVIMSGNFVQRGEPAICDKFSRARMALLNGADMVIELPVCYATGSAEFFAGGAVSLAEKSGIITELCFGSESGNLSELSGLAERAATESESYKKTIRVNLDKGCSFALSRGRALKTAPEKPNDILAVEYLKALLAKNSGITPYTIKRESDYHSEKLTSGFPSATAVRKALLNGRVNEALEAVPDNCGEIIKTALAEKTMSNSLDNYFKILQYIAASTPAKHLKQIQDMGEGLENRIIREALACNDMRELLSRIKTKRYAYTRIQRAVLHIILDQRTELLEAYKNDPPYIRVLGFRKEKSGLLRELTEKASVPVVINLKNAKKVLDAEAMALLEYEIKCGDIYNLGLGARRVKNYEYGEEIVAVG